MSRARPAALLLSLLIVTSACSGMLEGEILLGDPAFQGVGQEDEGSALAPPSTEEAPADKTSCPAGPAFAWANCSSVCPCDEGEGDCDGDNHCLPGLICRHNVGASYGVASTVDVCERPTADPEGESTEAPPTAPVGGAAEGDSCEQASCAAGLACIAVYSSSAASLIGRHCMELCESLGTDSACESGESCVLAASGEQVCFNPQSPSTGYTTADDAADPTPAPTTPEASGLCGMNAQEQGVFELLNAERAVFGLGALQCDEAGVRAARDHSQDMCDRDYFSHTSPEGDAPWDRLRAAGAQFSGAGENIAMGQPSPQSVHDAWMNSPGHRANMLNGSWTRVGIGYVLCGQYSPYWTEVFMQ